MGLFNLFHSNTKTAYGVRGGRSPKKVRLTYPKSKGKGRKNGLVRPKSISSSRSIFQRVLIAGGIVTLAGVFGLAIWFFLFSSSSSTSRQIAGPPVMTLEVTSEPTGATVVVDGQEKGVTPVSVAVASGHRRVELRKSGYSSYFTEFEVSGQPSLPAQSAGTTLGAVVSPVPVTGTIEANASENKKAVACSTPVLPTYPLTIELWPQQVVMQPLPRPLPGARLEYARYLNKDTVELTYLTAEGKPLPPGEEGLPTGLWLYHPSSSSTTTGQTAFPVVLTRATLEAVGHYHYSDSDIATSKNQPATLSSKLALTAPVVSPDEGRIAFISNALDRETIIANPKGQSGGVSKNTPASETTPLWDDQAIWLSRLAQTPSVGGNLLAGSGARSTDPSQPLRLFSLADLPTLLPGLHLPDPATVSPSYSSGRWATLRQLSWSPGGDKLLAVLEVSETVLTGNRSGNSGGGSSSTVTIMVMIGTGGGTPPGRASLLTPQPLTERVLPGTIVWNTGGEAIPFLVLSTAGSYGNGAAGLCLLDMSYRAKGSTNGGLSHTPLYYVGQINSPGVWNTRSDSGLTNLIGGRVYPPLYGAIRYNPFAWPLSSPMSPAGALIPSPSTGAPTSSVSAKGGLYSAAASNAGGTLSSSSSSSSSSSNGSNLINNLYAYSLADGVSRPIPFVNDSSQPQPPGSPPTPTPRSGQLPAQIKTGSYPYVGANRGSSPLYLAVRPVTANNSGEDGKKKSGGGLLGGGSSSVSWQLSVETFTTPPEIQNLLQRDTSLVEVAPGVTLKKLSERRQPTTLTSPGNTGLAISGLAPGKLEAQWRPDGRGALLVLPPPSSSGSQSANNLWLIIWGQ